MIILIATKNVLTRPWCLLELYEAHVHKLPLVLLPVENGGFNLEHGLHLIENIETELELQNPGALATIEAHLTTIGSTLFKFKRGLLSCLEAVVDTRLLWHPWGSDNAMIADAQDLVSAMAVAAGKKIAWQGGVQSSAATPLSKGRRASRRASFNRLRANKNVSYALFISYYRDEAKSDARLLHNQLEILLGRPVFIDASYAKDVSEGVNADEIRAILESGLGRSEAVVLLQTEGCLTRPWVLLELYVAAKLNIPIIPVSLANKGYDFKAATAFVDNLKVELEKANPGAVAAIQAYLDGSQGVNDTFEDVKAAAELIPKLISVSLDPEGSANQLDAAVRDIVAKAAKKKGAARESRPPAEIIEVEIKS